MRSQLISRAVMGRREKMVRTWSPSELSEPNRETWQSGKTTNAQSAKADRGGVVPYRSRKEGFLEEMPSWPHMEG